MSNSKFECSFFCYFSHYSLARLLVLSTNVWASDAIMNFQKENENENGKQM